MHQVAVPDCAARHATCAWVIAVGHSIRPRRRIFSPSASAGQRLNRSAIFTGYSGPPPRQTIESVSRRPGFEADVQPVVSVSQSFDRPLDRRRIVLDIAHKPDFPGSATLRDRHRVLLLGDIESHENFAILSHGPPSVREARLGPPEQPSFLPARKGGPPAQPANMTSRLHPLTAVSASASMPLPLRWHARLARKFTPRPGSQRPFLATPASAESIAVARLRNRSISSRICPTLQISLQMPIGVFGEQPDAEIRRNAPKAWRTVAECPVQD